MFQRSSSSRGWLRATHTEAVNGTPPDRLDLEPVVEKSVREWPFQESSLLFLALLGLLGGAIPAWKASRLRPTQALRRG